MRKEAKKGKGNDIAAFCHATHMTINKVTTSKAPFDMNSSNISVPALPLKEKEESVDVLVRKSLELQEHLLGF